MDALGVRSRSVKMLTVRPILSIALVVVLLIHVWRSWKECNRHVYNHFPGICWTVDGIAAGSQDIHTLSDGLTFITSGLKITPIPAHPVLAKRKGRIFMFDFNQPERKAAPLLIEGAVTLQSPHGLALWEDRYTERVILFVVDHHEDGERVEKFQFHRRQRLLKHLETITDPAFGWISDVVATSDDHFYVTNRMYSSSGLGRRLERHLGHSWGEVLHYDGVSCSKMATGLTRPSGINISPDGRLVYVSLGDGLGIFERGDNNALELREVEPLHTELGHIDICRLTGDLWIGSQPDVVQHEAHLANPTLPSPSQVLRVRVVDGHVIEVEEVYSEYDRILHGSSSACSYNRTLLVGSTHHKLMMCQLAHVGL